MKNRLRCLIITLMIGTGLCLLAGCGPEGTLFGAGVTAGAIGTETVQGLRADRAVWEATLQEQYAKAVAEGAPQATLERLELSIRRVQGAEPIIDTAEQGLRLDWNDPAAIGGYAGTLLSLFFLRKSQAEKLKEKIRRKALQSGIDKTLAGSTSPEEIETLSTNIRTATLEAKAGAVS